jgi:hypothetical protein
LAAVNAGGNEPKLELSPPSDETEEGMSFSAREEMVEDLAVANSRVVYPPR